jgi:hypothetical protein
VAIVIQGDANAFNALVYGQERHPGTVAYLQQQLSSFTGALTDFGQQFVQSAQAIYDTFNSAEAVRAARAAVRRFDSLLLPDRIQYLDKIGHLQNAPVAMQRWVMTHPATRELYHKQLIDGYSDTYIDHYWNRTKFEHYDWRVLMNGVMQEVKTDDMDGHITYHFLAELQEGDREPTMDETTDALNTWDVQDVIIEQGIEDFTSKAGCKR